MRLRNLFMTLPILAFAIQSQAKLEAHEWGTFTSLVGSNGVTQNGMYHEDEKLPDFVHGFGETLASAQLSASIPTPLAFPGRAGDRCPRHSKACFSDEFLDTNLITQKMETPVIYFYSDRQQKVEVNVRFPEGIVTDTFPAPVATFPLRDTKTLGNGNSTFSVEVLPQLTGNIPFVDPHNIYSHARNVASNLVRSGNEEEKFIFYRGLGRFQPKISITSHEGTLNLAGAPESIPSAAFLVHVDSSGHGQLMSLTSLTYRHQESISPRMLALLADHSGANPTKQISSGELSRVRLTDALTRAGLNLDEAVAMVDTWENGYLKVPGLRLLYILPKAEVDQILPLRISPTPDKLERVFVGRIEILLDTEESRILNQVLQARDSFDVRSLGRFAEPMLRRVAEVYAQTERQIPRKMNPEILSLFSRLIDKASKESFLENSSLQ